MSTDLYLFTSDPYGATDIVLRVSAAAGASDEPAESGGGDWRRWRNPLPPERRRPPKPKKKRRPEQITATVTDGSPLVVTAATLEEAFALLALIAS